MQRTRRRKRRIGAHKLRDSNRRLVHQIVGDLTVFQIRVERIIFQTRHHLLYHIHLAVVPGLLNLRIAVTLLFQ
ncbi:Uncharacterised protein [Salmonella enterica subsp. enterica serovar Bovismorbificans]|uniref:Uncharacterized protein n=1 Tax=Salmonella enterica subsp. enterica serovar Bovismorbificans TaxID=58097 RepID=A0A655CZZ7_SALET|nr:Uncharacterised protein [Salmonella enterica subsp. enterica serovar Bovismorbificans]